MPARKMRQKDPRQLSFSFSERIDSNRLKPFLALRASPSNSVSHPKVKAAIKRLHQRLVAGGSMSDASPEERAAFVLWENRPTRMAPDQRGGDYARGELFRFRKLVLHFRGH